MSQVNSDAADLIGQGIYIGADGCSGGWALCILDRGRPRIEFKETIEEAAAACPAFDAFLIDMVIGLPGGKKEKRPDNMARKELGGRASTVFSAPCRQTLAYDPRTQAVEIREKNKEILKKSLSSQTMAILPKIKELDCFLQDHPEYRGRILESHPEVCFKRFFGAPVSESKKDLSGFMKRTKILADYLPEEFLLRLPDMAKDYRCRPDDLMDAACLAVTAAFSAHGMCDTILEEPMADETGLEMKLTVPGEQIRQTFHRQKTAVVTGGAGGIGKCIADEFRKQGVRVFVIDRAQGDHFVGDICDKKVLETFADAVIRECGGSPGCIDYLINNAPPLMKGIDDCSYEEFQQALAAGVAAPFYLSKLLAPYFREGGCIVNISSSRDRMSQPQTESYSAAKGGIAALTHAMAASFAGRIRVNSISPGWIDTKNRVYEGPDALQQPAGRVGSPMDIAAMVTFLCSDRAGFITGENICIDGGMTKLMIYHEDHGWTYDPGQA